MSDLIKKVNNLQHDLEKAKTYFYDNLKHIESPVHVYTHLDADGLCSGAILGKALYRANIPFQITVLKQLEKEEIVKISKKIEEFENFLIFSDFGSGQYLELQEKLSFNNQLHPLLILDHHLPQKISDMYEEELIDSVHKKTFPWHINPYFYGIDGSTEISGAGICYFFAKILNGNNIDLSPIAIIGATGDIQNQGPHNTFTGLNSMIVGEAEKLDLIDVVNDLNFSSLKPLNKAIAYSSEIDLPGLTNDVNKTLKFLQTLGILMENPDGTIKTLNELNQDEKQKVSSAVIEYCTLKLDIEPQEIIDKLITNKYVLKKEREGSDLYDTKDFSNLLNACGRTDNASLGIAIAMGDRKESYRLAKEYQINYKKNISKGLSWIFSENKLQQRKYIQYFFGEDVIPESIIGTIASMLVFDNSDRIDKSKPIFGLAKRKNENVYKISGRAHDNIVKKGVNLSEAIRKACALSNVNALGGGHPPAAGTKVPVDKAEIFLKNCDDVIKNQLNA